MKVIAVFALLFVIAVSSIHADDPDVNGDKIPASAILEATKTAVQENIEFVAVDNFVAPIDKSDDGASEFHPVFHKLFRKCNNGECRKKCNDKGENGACIWFVCVCWK